MGLGVLNRIGFQAGQFRWSILVRFGFWSNFDYNQSNFDLNQSNFALNQSNFD